jgi:hypothetical protein
MLTPVRILFLCIAMLWMYPAAAQDVKSHAQGAVKLGWSYFNKGDTSTALKRFNQASFLTLILHLRTLASPMFTALRTNLILQSQTIARALRKTPRFLTHTAIWVWPFSIPASQMKHCRT